MIKNYITYSKMPPKCSPGQVPLPTSLKLLPTLPFSTLPLLRCLVCWGQHYSAVHF